MTYPTWWEAGRVHQVFTTESRQKERDLFLATHRPFRRIRVDFCKEGNLAGDFIGEEELRTLIHGGPIGSDNRLFFVTGEAGSGKSELCQWLEYAADGDSRLAIHVPRSLTTAAHVAALLRRRLGALSPSAPLGLAPLAIRARHVALSAVVLLYERGGQRLTPAHAWERLLMSDDLVDAVATYLAPAEGGRSPAPLLPDRRVRGLCDLARIRVDGDSAAQVAEELRALLQRAIDQVLWLGDLRTLLGELSGRAVAAGQRPLLLIEDITAFQALGDLLLDYLLDLTSGHFDAVVGVTTGYERTQLAGAAAEGDLTHIHHRLRGRFVLTDEQGRAYGLEEDLVEFARAYLAAATGNGGTQIPRAFEPGLYPFTQTSLRRAFTCLEEEGNPRQTPRLLVEHVLGTTLLAGDMPPLTLDRSPYLRRPPALFRRDVVSDERLQALLRWYGAVGEREVTLDRSIADYWGIAVPDGLCRDGQIRVPRAYAMQETAPVEVDTSWQRHVRELQHWLDTGGLYPSREILKRGIERVVLGLGDPRALGSPSSLALGRAELYYARGDERLPISLGDGSGDVTGSDAAVKVEVTRTPEERAILEELAYLSLSGQQLAPCCQNLALTLEWARRHWDAYHGRVRALFAERLGGVTTEELIWVAWRLVATACGAPWDRTPHLRIREADAPPYAAASPWDPATHRDCYSAGEGVSAWHETIRRLFIGSFTLRESFLDLERCRAMVAHIDTLAVLTKLAEVPPTPLRSAPFKVRPSGQSLYEMIVPLQRYARALVDLDLGACLRADAADLSQRAIHLRAQDGMDLVTLRRQLDSLRWQCAEAGVVWQQTWDAPLQALASVAHDDLRLLSEATDAACNECGALAAADARDVWSYQDFRHRLHSIVHHPYWEAVSTLVTIREEMLRAGRARYRRDGRMLTATAAYRELLGEVRALRQELTHG
jgi:hypothetical protein